MSVVGFIAISSIAQAGGLEFKAELLGDEEVPPVVTNAKGDAKFELNRAETEIEFEFEVKNSDGILGKNGAHIHCAAFGFNGPIVVFLAGAAGPAGFDGKVEMKGTFTDAQIMTGTGCGDTISALADAMANGDTYVNVHSFVHAGGEVRGQIELDD